MLTENSKLENIDDRVLCVIMGACAYDPQTKAYLRRTDGRHKAGQRSKYYLHWEMHELKLFKAYSDVEAIEKAVLHMQKRFENEAWDKEQKELEADNEG